MSIVIETPATPVTTEEFLSAVQEIIRKKRCGAAEAVDAVFDSLTLSPEALWYFARLGAQYEARELRAALFRSEDSHASQVVRGLSQAERNRHAFLARPGFHLGESALHLSREGWDDYVGMASAHIAGWSRKRKAAKGVVIALSNAGVTRIADLPLTEQRRLEGTLREAWEGEA